MSVLQFPNRWALGDVAMLAVLTVYFGVGVVWFAVALALNEPPGAALVSAILWPLRVLYEIGRVALLLGD